MSERPSAARGFMAAHARVLDRRRYELLFDGLERLPAPAGVAPPARPLLR